MPTVNTFCIEASKQFQGVPEKNDTEGFRSNCKAKVEIRIGEEPILSFFSSAKPCVTPTAVSSLFFSKKMAPLTSSYPCPFTSRVSKLYRIQKHIWKHFLTAGKPGFAWIAFHTLLEPKHMTHI